VFAPSEQKFRADGIDGASDFDRELRAPCFVKLRCKKPSLAWQEVDTGVSSYGVATPRSSPSTTSRVVMPLDVEGARAVPEHAYLAGLRRLDPNRRRIGPDVAEVQADEQVGDQEALGSARS
jgi:hypothetical protein